MLNASAMRALSAIVLPGRPSISGKLTRAVVAGVLGAMLLVAGGVVLQETQRHTRSKLDYLDATAAVFASATSRAVAAQDAAGAAVALRGVGRAPDILYARIDDPQGRPIAQIGTVLQLAADIERAADGSSTLDALRSRTLQMSRPVVQGGRVVGRITLVADNTDLRSRLAAALAQTALGTLLALAIAVLVAGRMKQAVVRPLLSLTETVRRIGQSDKYDVEVAVESDDEVGELCGGFNQMLGEIRARERRISDLAYHDSETDLPNRHAFERAIGQRAAEGKPFAVAALGVDRFQYVRGAIGYRMANDLLAEIGARVVALGETARVSTDVIGVLIDAPDADAATQKATSLLMLAEEPVLLGESTLEVGVSVGLALWGLHGDTPTALVERASIALDQAHAARTKTHLFDPDAYETTSSNVSLMVDLVRAISSGELRIHLQPKFDLRTREVCGAEVLARWRHPVRGMVPPDLFVGMAEDTGAISLLTEWSLKEAVACQRRLAAAGVETGLSVNLSGRLLDDSAFIAMAAAQIARRHGEIYLEITETASIDNHDRALHNIEILTAAGAFISIDDYGAGLSSLSYLKRIPAQELKIDRTFIHLLDENSRDALLVKSTIDLAHSLGMKVTAEGVETESTLAALTAMGCDCAQGYIIGKPMAESDYLAFLSERTVARA